MLVRPIGRALAMFSLCATLLIGTAPSPAGTGTATYEYDDLGRLKSAVFEDGSRVDYQLTPGGNRQSVTTTVPPPGVAWAATGYSVSETGANVTVTINRLGGTAIPASVNYATVNGTATAGSDYTAKSGTISWAAADGAPRPIVIPILDDASLEGNHSFSVRLSAPVGLAISGPTDTVVTIADVEPGSLRWSSPSYSAVENGGSTTITVSRVDAFHGAVSVTYATSNGTATAGSDYTARTGTLSWANGDSANKSFTLSLLDDSSVEGSETVNLALSSPTGGATLGTPSSAVLSINDNDFPPVGSIQVSSASSVIIGEAGPSVTVSANRTGGSFGAVTVTYGTTNIQAVGGSDFTAVTGTLSWANGDTAEKSFTVPIINDTVAEPQEVFSADISNPTGGATLGTLTSVAIFITDDDPGVPATPTNFGITTGTSPSFAVFWDATVTNGYYELDEDLFTADWVAPGYTRYTINPPAHSKNFNKGSGESEWWYRVRACNASGQCSGWTNSRLRRVCGSGACQ